MQARTLMTAFGVVSILVERPDGFSSWIEISDPTTRTKLLAALATSVEDQLLINAANTLADEDCAGWLEQVRGPQDAYA